MIRTEKNLTWVLALHRDESEKERSLSHDWTRHERIIVFGPMLPGISMFFFAFFCGMKSPDLYPKVKNTNTNKTPKPATPFTSRHPPAPGGSCVVALEVGWQLCWPSQTRICGMPGKARVLGGGTVDPQGCASLVWGYPPPGRWGDESTPHPPQHTRKDSCVWWNPLSIVHQCPIAVFRLRVPTQQH